MSPLLPPIAHGPDGRAVRRVPNKSGKTMGRPAPRVVVELPRGVWIVVLVIVSLVLEVPGSIAAIVRV